MGQQIDLDIRDNYAWLVVPHQRAGNTPGSHSSRAPV